MAFLGIDIGTSGIRACCIDDQARQLVQHRIDHIKQKSPITEDGSNEQLPDAWLSLLDELIEKTSIKLHALDATHKIQAIAIDGTSSTLIACRRDGEALSPALMYNDQQSKRQAEKISRFAPETSAVHGASSSLAKAFLLIERYPQTELLCHQADWLSSSLTGRYGISDENNCLKLGYDSINTCWPEWLFENDTGICIDNSLLPDVVAPGSVIGKVKPELIDRYGLDENCVVVAGTTDSNAAVLATGANRVGDAVTALGSTLVIKLFSEKPVFNAKYGIYSHHLNDHWLVGGASNSGGATLLQYFSRPQLDKMTPYLDPERSTGYQYYPLPVTGERFPVNDANKENMTTPRPDSDTEFFQALLEGISGIEAEGYNKLTALGAGSPQRIYTTGGGNKNPAWKKIRERILGVTVVEADHDEACYGSALLARMATSR